jgi:hypothetical protein
LQANRRQDPNAQPDQIEDYEKDLRPCGKAKQRRKSILKSRNKLLHEMQTLRSQPDQKDACRSLTADEIAVYGPAQNRQEKRHNSSCRKPGRSREYAP